MALFNLILLSDEEREQRKLANEERRLRIAKMKRETSDTAYNIGTALGSLMNKLEQDADATRIKYQDAIAKAIEGGADPKVIENLTEKMNEEIYKKWFWWKSQLKLAKKWMQDAGVDPEFVQTVEQLDQYQPFTFMNVSKTPANNFVVQEVAPDGTVFSTFKAETPDSYKKLVESLPEVREYERKMEPAMAQNIKALAEQTGMSERAVFERLHPLPQSNMERTVRFIADVKGLPIEKAYEEYRGMQLSIDMTAMQKNWQTVNTHAAQVIDYYNKSVPDEFKINPSQLTTPLSGLLMVDPEKVKDPKKRAMLQSTMDAIVSESIKAFNPSAASIAYKKMLEVYRNLGNMRRAIDMFNIRLKKGGKVPNIVQKMVYNSIGKLVQPEHAPLIKKLFTNADEAWYKSAGTVFNTIRHSLFGSALTKTEAESFKQAVTDIGHSNIDNFLGLYTLINDIYSQMQGVKAVVGDVAYYVKFRGADLAIKSILDVMDEVAKELDIKADSISATMGVTDKRVIGKRSKAANKVGISPSAIREMQRINRGVETPYNEAGSPQKEKKKAPGSFNW